MARMKEETQSQSSPAQSPVTERPHIFSIPGGFELRWSFTDLDISAYVTHITDKAMAEVAFYTATPEQIEQHRETLLLAPNHVDFLSANQKYTLTKQLHNVGHTDEYVAFCDWERKVNDIALAVIQNCRRDIPASYIGGEDDTPLAADYVVKPILYKDVPNVIFGDYGSYKSITAMILAYIAQLPYSENKLGLVPDGKSTNVLWLDYEAQPVSFRKRWAAIQHGFHLGYDTNEELVLPVLYKEMTVPLADTIEPIQYEMAEHGISLLIIDSLGPAAGGNLNDPEPAVRYHQALRILGGTSLTLAHNSKDLTTGTKSIFGSVFFSNLARAIWQCKADKEASNGRGTISLKQVKASLSQLHGTLGFCYDFDEAANTITASKGDLTGTSLAGELPLSVRIKDLLRSGAKTVKEIGDAFDAKEDSVRMTLHRLKKQGAVVQLGDKWGLVAA